jgi:hypothetical protein
LSRPESFRNRDQNFITRAASLERDTFFGMIHRSYFGLGMPVIVGSHTTLPQRDIPRAGWLLPGSPDGSYLIMLRLRALGKRGIYVDEVLAVGELPSTWGAFLGQQQRWASGGLDCCCVTFHACGETTRRRKTSSPSCCSTTTPGHFFHALQDALFALLLGGIALRLETNLIVAIAVFTIVAMIANHLWERQFFIERSRRTYLLESAVMNNFLGGLYFLSLFKAVLAPNTAFTRRQSAVPDLRPHRAVLLPVAAAIILVVEIAGLVAAWIYAAPSIAPQDLDRHDIVRYRSSCRCWAHWPFCSRFAGTNVLLPRSRRIRL